MEEQVIPPAERPRGSKTLLAIVLIAVILVGLLVAYFAMRGGAWDAAAYIPNEVVLAVTVDLSSTPDKDAARSFIEGIFKDAGVEDPLNEAFKNISKELKLNFEKDVVARLNGRAAFAVLPELSAMIPCTIGVVGAKSEAQAEKLMDTITDKMSQNKVKFTRQEYKGFSYLRIPTTPPPDPNQMFTPQFVLYLGAAKGALLAASSDSAFKKAVDTLNGKPSLLSERNFTRLRDTGKSTFATTYFSGPGFFKLMEPWLAISAGMTGGSDAIDEMKKNMENMLAVVTNAKADRNGLKLSTLIATKEEGPQLAEAKLDDLVASVPENAAAVMAIKSWDKIWPEFKKGLNANPTVKPQMDEAITQIKQMLGIDLFTDLLDRITSVTAYYLPMRIANSNNFPGHINLVLTVDKPAVVEPALHKIQSAAAMAGSPFRQMDVSGQNVYATTMDADGHELAYAVVGDKVVVTISGRNIAEGMKAAIAGAQGKAASVATTDAFRLVKQQVPARSTSIFYGDVAQVVNTFRPDIPAEAGRAIDAVFKKVGPFGVTGSNDEGLTVIPFKR